MTGYQHAERAIEAARAVGPHGSKWEKWATAWLKGGVVPALDATHPKLDPPTIGVECLLRPGLGSWAAWRAWCAARAADLPAQAERLADEAVEYAQRAAQPEPEAPASLFGEA